MVYGPIFSKDEKRFLGVLYPDGSDDIHKVYTIKCQMISFEDTQQTSTVEVTYSLVDFNLEDGRSIGELINWKNIAVLLSYPRAFDANTEKIGENEYKLRNIRLVTPM